MATIQNLTALGYSTGVAFTTDKGVQIWSVEGFGVATYVPENDAAQIDSLADPARISAFDNPAPDPAVQATPSAADAVLGALAGLDPTTASVADVVNAVKAALQQAGAKPAT